jgi:hypothetical protein
MRLIIMGEWTILAIPAESLEKETAWNWNCSWGIFEMNECTGLAFEAFSLSEEFAGPARRILRIFHDNASLSGDGWMNVRERTSLAFRASSLDEELTWTKCFRSFGRKIVMVWHGVIDKNCQRLHEPLK